MFTVRNMYGKLFTANRRWERIWKIAQVDFKKRYYNDKFGLLWALINPLTQIALYYFVFTEVMDRGQDNFALYLFSGIIIWISFSQGTTIGLRVLVSKIHLIESVQFNWLDLYTSHMVSVVMGMVFNLMAYGLLVIILGASFGSYFYYFPIVFVSWFLVTSGICIILGIIRPLFEDIAHIWALVIMIGFWVSGIFFSGTYFLDNYEWFGYINPFVGIILNARACLLEGNEIVYSYLWINLLYGLLIYLLAVWTFKKNSRKIAEKL